MARIQINLGTPPSGTDGDPVRTAFEKTNLMFSEIYSGLNSGVGGSSPIAVASSGNADTLPAINAVFVFANGGSNIPVPNCYVQQFTVEGNFRRQVARDLTSNATWERYFSAGTLGANWQRVVKAGDFGIGALNNATYIGNLIDPSSYRTSGTYFAQWNLAGIGGVVGTLTVESGNSSSWLGQTVLNHETGALFTRGQSDTAAGAFTPWRRTYNDQNSQNDPQTGGGLMSATSIGGWIVEKYINGNMTVFGTPVLAQVPVNGVSTQTITIPAFGWSGETGVYTSLQPYLTFDFYGVLTSYLESQTKLVIAVRNGATAQQFASKVFMKGRWKP